MILMNRFRILLTLTSLLIMTALNCKKSENMTFPNVKVEEYVFLNSPSNFNLTTPGGWIYHTGGYKGLIVYRRSINNPSSDFGAYDRACPEHYSKNCATMHINPDGIYAECDCNGEKYLLLNGSPAEGSRYSLIQYQVSFDGQVLSIFN